MKLILHVLLFLLFQSVANGQGYTSYLRYKYKTVEEERKFLPEKHLINFNVQVGNADTSKIKITSIEDDQYVSLVSVIDFFDGWQQINIEKVSEYLYSSQSNNPFSIEASPKPILIIKGKLYFQDIKVKSFYSDRVEYLSDVRFFGNSFTEDNTFTGSIFNNNLDFTHCWFTEPATFERAIFKKGIRLDHCHFKTLSNFNYAIFGKNSSTKNTDFGNRANFAYSTIKSNDFFNYCVLPDTLDIQNMKMELSNGEILDLTKTHLNKQKNNKCILFIYGVDLSKILIPYDRFIIKTSDVYRDEENFDDDNRYSEDIITIFETLIKTSKDAGMTESAKGWDIELQRMQNFNKFSFFAYPINTFNCVWWNFGYEKWRILWIWLPLLFFIFLLVNISYPRWVLTFYRDDELGKNFGRSFKDSDTHRSKIYFLFLTAIIYFGLKIKHSAVDYKNKKGVAYVYFMYLMGSIHLAFALSYILNIY